MSGYDEKKSCPCVVCGKEVEVTKFATPSKVKCDECKSGNVNLPDEERPMQYAQWSQVSDPELRNICCLSCGSITELISLVKSPWGDLITAQCPHCFLVIRFSEQQRKQKWMLKKTPLDHMPSSDHRPEDCEEQPE